ADDEKNPQELVQVQSLIEKQGTKDDDPDACNRCPDRVSDADVESEQRETEKVSGDGTADQRGDGPPGPGEPLCISCGDGDRDLKDHGGSKIQPAHGWSFLEWMESS